VVVLLVVVFALYALLSGCLAETLWRGDRLAFREAMKIGFSWPIWILDQNSLRERS
jgi:hypothetical protein